MSPPVLGDRHHWHAVRAYLFELGGHDLEAGESYALAASRVGSVMERDHLVRRAARARERARLGGASPETPRT